MSIKFGAGKMDSDSSYVSFNEENEKTPILKAEDNDVEEKKTWLVEFSFENYGFAFWKRL